MRRLLTLLVVAVAALSFSVAQAAAEEPGGAAQAAGQSATSGQGAGADGAAYQSGATNSAMNIRVLSPGDNGAVSQSNTTTAIGVAKNDNTTNQSVGQSQTGGGYGSDYAQIAGQSTGNDQRAAAGAAAVQAAPSNDATSIRVLSPGNDGKVTQSNDATAGAIAANDNDTTQTTDQSQTGGGSGSDYTQIAGQDAANRQSAAAGAAAVQLKPSNEASSIRVLSPGTGGDVSQSNSTTAVAAALNSNDTEQSIDQEQAGASSKDGGSDYTQIAGQGAKSAQAAEAGALAVQVAPSNTSSSIRVLSPGNDGAVSQSNTSTAIAAALNENDTTQSIDQTQTGHGSGDYLQVAGQGAWSSQAAEAAAVAVQLGASNENAPVRVGSPGSSGSVKQSNAVGSLAAALNGNATSQSLTQAQTGYGSNYLQVAGQGSWNAQWSGAMSLALQGMLKKERRR
jgi:hypothetical protein